MTQPDESGTAAGTARPGGAEHDPEQAEEYAESVSIDPSPTEIDHYLDLVGDEKNPAGTGAAAATAASVPDGTGDVSPD